IIKIVEFSPVGRKQKRRGGFHIRPDTGSRLAGAYRMRPYDAHFLSGAPATRSTAFIIFYLFFII
uniref:hypothetical protein n=1 Tax=Gemmiger formicilis TaxID=745368 RepID=UPI004029FFFF